MDTILSTNRNSKRMFVSILSIFAILAMVFPAKGVAYAQDSAHKVGLVVTESGIADNSFNQLAYQGLQRAGTELGVTSSLYTPEGPEGQNGYDAMLQQCAKDGNELCIAVGFPFGVSLANAARANPDTKWGIVDYTYPDCGEGANEGVDCGSFTELSNVRGLRFNEKQAGYLAGTLAGGMTASQTIGVVGGMEIPPVVAFVEGYRNGAQCTNPSVNVLSTYTGTFVDPGVGASAAQDMIEQGADVIFGAAGLTGDGAILHSAQNGHWAIGVDADEYLTVFSNGSVAGSDKLLSSAMKRVDNAVYQTLEDYVTGNFSAGTVLYDLTTDGVGLAPFHETDSSISQVIKDKLAIVRQGIIDGMVNIDACPWLIAFPENDAVEAWEFPAGAKVTLTIDNAPVGFERTGVAQVTTWGDPRTYVRLEFAGEDGYDLKAGDTVTLTDSFGTTVTHTVQNLSVTTVNIKTDTVTGTADPGTMIQVWPHEFDQTATIELTTAENGVWQADFRSVGFDLFEGMIGGRSQVLVGGNATAVDWNAYQTYDIYAFNPLTGAIQRITYLANTDEYNPSWSPNGKLVAHDVVRNTPYGTYQSIYITDVKTGVSTPLVGAENGGNDAVWSPNGKWFAFDRPNEPDPASNSSIYVVPAEGGTPTLVRADAVSADWAPNGKRLVFQRPSDGSIRTVAVDGGRGGETIIAASGANPSWSPDGNWIAYEQDGDIWKVSVNVQGTTFGNPIPVTSGPFNDGQPTWSADSLTIVYHSGFNDDWDLWSVPATGGMGTWLNGAPEVGDYDPAYARNSSKVAYGSFSPDGQAARTWVAAYTYDASTWSVGDHVYHFEAEWNGGNETTPEVSFTVANDAPQYYGYVLLRGLALRANIDGACPVINPRIHLDQLTRFHNGYVTDYPMTFAESQAYFDSLIAKVVWDGGESADFVRNEIIPYQAEAWPAYYCTFTVP